MLKVYFFAIIEGIDSYGLTGVTALYLATDDGFFEVADLLIRAGANVNKTPQNDMSPLMAALFFCQGADSFNGKAKKCIELLLEAGANVNADDNDDTALHIASMLGLYEAVDQLIQAGADVNILPKSGVTALMRALREEDWEVFTDDEKKVH